jgi:D-mannonate dehydratase
MTVLSLAYNWMPIIDQSKSTSSYSSRTKTRK